MFSKKEFLARLCVIVVAGFLAMGVWQSEGFAAWTEITIPGTTEIDQVAVADSILFASADSGVFRSTNSGTTWQKVTGLRTFNKIEGNNTSIFAGQRNDSLFFSSDKGISWNADKTIDSAITLGGIADFSVQNNEILFIQNDRSYLSESIGQTPMILNTTTGSVSACCHIMGNSLFLGGIEGVYSSADLGHSWHESNYGIYELRTNSVSEIASTTRILYAGLLSVQDLQTSLYCSVDSGYSWKSMRFNHSVNAISFSKTSAFIGAGGYGVNDSGGVFAAPLDSSDWTDISITQKTPAYSLATDTGYLYAIQDDSTGFNSTYQSTIYTSFLYRRPLSEVNALLKQQVPGPQQSISTNFVIDHFASQQALGISFSPGRTERVSLKVYSATGKTIATLFDGSAQSGDNKFIWDYKNVPSGIYCISLQSDNGRAVKKVQVMR
jgi:Secretion system C-terminal sorting domain